jgi:hypothetical protein
VRRIIIIKKNLGLEKWRFQPLSSELLTTGMNLIQTRKLKNFAMGTSRGLKAKVAMKR